MSSRVIKNKKVQKQTSIKSTVATIVICALAVLLFFEAGFLVMRTREYFGFVSYDDLNNLGDVELNLNQGDYYYTIDEYVAKAREDARHNIEETNSSGLLIDSVYDYLIEGVASEYFESTTIISYEQYQKDADTFVNACKKLEASGYEVDENYECTEDCMFKSYLEQFIRPDKREQFEEAHRKYHAALKVQKDALNLTDGELKYYYEAFLLCQLDNIEEIEVDLTYLTAKNLYLDDEVLNWYTRSSLAKPFKLGKTLTIADKDALAYLDLTYDAGLFDSSIVPSVANMLYQLGDQLENREGNDVTVIDITGIDDYEDYVNRKKAEKGTGTNVRDSRCFFPISISERYEGEQIYVMYNVINCKHKETLPDYEQFINSELFDDILRKRLESDLWTDLTAQSEDNVESESVTEEVTENIEEEAEEEKLSAEEIADILGAVG